MNAKILEFTNSVISIVWKKSRKGIGNSTKEAWRAHPNQTAGKRRLRPTRVARKKEGIGPPFPDSALTLGKRRHKPLGKKKKAVTEKPAHPSPKVID